MIRFTCSITLAFLSATMLYSQQKPTMMVTFSIRDTVYQEAMEANEETATLSDYESSGAEALADLLNDAFPFIDFTTVTSSTKISFTLVRKTLAINILDTLGLGGHNKVVGNTIQFRGITEVEKQAPANLDAFIEELQNKCTAWINQYRDNLILNLFSNIKLCDQATAKPEDGDWIMPFTRNTLRIGLGSSLLVKATIPSKVCEFNTKAAGPPDFAPDGNLVCSFVKDQVNSGCLNQILHASIEGVYLIKFEEPVLSQIHPQ